MTDDADADDRFLLKFNDDKVVFLVSPSPFPQRWTLETDVRFVKHFTRPDLWAKSFTHEKCVNCDYFDSL